MDDKVKFAFEQAIALSDHLTTLGLGVLVLSVGFMKDVVQHPTREHRRLLAASWVAYLLAIFAGMWLRMAAVGTLGTDSPDIDHLRGPAAAQIVLFSLATLLFTILALRALQSRTTGS